ncbi:endonuclease/exonuclease/phosphatase [Formosa agariphila KMM 3901]|uniref:Endonuclease/exonuclease/phosphatase n=1 Tax=Formosa agariphila (strain DSM 15362 / KCTC 12365 / LMG 23005 / KMM 3901 / M-2Alg 35-1) TaxID=1347342 RepID=T2KMK6_FORAG|nr:endonuclease/exonuclease/phosphatase family protein [Formosa agariphila]CDF79970.1 endonuclease/exonuclease/phosphatase [Formosa agariphila KMM 3901]
MAKFNVIDKFIFFINSILATLLLLSYILPFFPPKQFALLSVLGLTVPFLIIINVLFVLYWLLKLKRQMVLSALVLILGYFCFGAYYKFSSSTSNPSEDSLSVMSYNVRMFNVYNWIPDTDVGLEISKFVAKEQPDILSLQEFHPKNASVDFSFYKYKYIQLAGEQKQFGQSIYSKHPIINKGSVTFPDTPNNAIFVDVVKGADTIRVYNIHLQSLKINPEVEELKKQDSERLFKSIGQSFATQQRQTELFLEHKAQCNYKMIITGDLNNTASSYVYRMIKGNLNDTFKEAGSGFGKTFNFKFFPVRIDFIFTDDAFNINGFKIFNDAVYSDHYPIMTTLSL